MDSATDDGESENPLATVLSGGMLVSASRVVALGLGYLTQLVMARLLTESGYGSVVLTLAVVNIAVLLATLGLNEGLMREFPYYEDEPEKLRGIVRAGFVISAVSGALVALALFLAAPVLAQRVFDSPSLAELLRIAAVGIPFIVLGKSSIALTRGSRDAKPHAIVDQLVRPSLRLVLIAVLVLAGFGAVGAMAGQIVAMGLAGLLATVLALRLLPSPRDTAAAMYWPVLAFSLPLIAVQGMNFLNSNLDIYLIGYFLDSARVGVYNIALQLGTMITVVHATMAFLLPPTMTRLNKEGKHDELLATYQGLTKWMTMLGIPIFTVLFFAPEVAIGFLFGSRYTDGALVLQILAVGKLISLLAGLNFNSLVALGDNRIVAYLMFVQILLNFAATYLLIPVYGIEGAAAALVGSAAAGDALGATVLFKRYGVHPVHRSLFLPVALLGSVAAAGYVAITVSGLPLWLVAVPVGLGYPLVVVRFAVESRDEVLLGLFEDRIGRELTPIRAVVSRLQ